MQYTPKCRVRIDTAALTHNYAVITSLSRGRKIFCVVKADAYGHGASIVVPALLTAGARAFAVSNTAEALEARALAPDADVLILGWTPPEDAAALVGNRIMQTAADADHAASLADAVARAKDAGKLPQDARLDIHIKFDTGMNRIGYRPGDSVAVTGSTHVRVAGVFTHLPVADDPEKDDITRRALRVFDEASAPLASAGAMRHAANSAAILRADELSERGDGVLYDAVRAGIILYGLPPAPTLARRAAELDLKPVMTFESLVSHIHTVRAGECIGYGGAYTAQRDMVVATVPAGYADGVVRAWCGEAYIRGRRYRAVGRVCMDQLMLDVTGAPDIAVGDEVVFFGGAHPGSTEEFAAASGTINYEIVTRIGPRVVRLRV